jgi:hypothetical protein
LPNLEVKSTLAQIAKKEGRSLAQISELFLKAGIHEYAKKGPDYLRPLLDHPAQEIPISKRAPRKSKFSRDD